jgi:hypothetical protein
MKKPTKAVVKPAAKAAAKPATKRPRTYKKADLPRTARAYLGKKYNVHMDKENEAVAKLIEMHDATLTEARKALAVESDYAKAQAEREAHMEMLFPYPPKNIPLTLREKFLAWIGAR